MAFNRLADRRLDALNPRTQARHLPTGTLGVATVALFTVACSLGFVAGTFLFLPRNPLPLYASVPVLLFLFGYSYAKRFTVLSHFWLGAALMLAPVAAWVAIRAEVAWPPLVLGAAVMLWVAGFDVIYACQDVEVDRRDGLHSLPADMGLAPALAVARALHALMLAALVVAGWSLERGVWYYIGIAVTGLLLAYEHRLVSPRDLSRVNAAFFTTNGVISLLLLGAAMADTIP